MKKLLIEGVVHVDDCLGEPETDEISDRCVGLHGRCVRFCVATEGGSYGLTGQNSAKGDLKGLFEGMMVAALKEIADSADDYGDDDE